MTTAVHVEVHGRVQGVGYRTWTAREAERLGLAGWVRNRPAGTVESAFTGPDEAVAAMLRALERGPAGAVVERIARLEEMEIEGAGFEVRATG